MLVTSTIDGLQKIEEVFPDRPLLPQDEAKRKEALEVRACCHYAAPASAILQESPVLACQGRCSNDTLDRDQPSSELHPSCMPLLYLSADSVAHT